MLYHENLQGTPAEADMDALPLVNSQPIPVAMRFQVEPGDVFCLPPVKQLCIEQGVIRVTRNGKKHSLIRSGDLLTGASLPPDALLTVMGKSSAVIEVILPHPDCVMMIFDILMELRARQQAASRSRVKPHKSQHMCRTA